MGHRRMSELPEHRQREPAADCLMGQTPYRRGHFSWALKGVQEFTRRDRVEEHREQHGPTCTVYLGTGRKVAGVQGPGRGDGYWAGEGWAWP